MKAKIAQTQITPDVLSLVSQLSKLVNANAPAITLKQAAEATIEGKVEAMKCKQYIGSLKQYFNLFVSGREQMLVREVTVDTLNKWFKDRCESPYARASNIGRLSALFTHSIRQGWITDNPCHRLERYSIPKGEAKILTVEQCSKLLHSVEKNKPCALAFLALTLFAGVRPAECSGITWADIGDYVKVSAAASKVRTRRLIRLEPAAVDWLERARLLKSTLPVSEITRKRFTWFFRDVLGLVDWIQDLNRHSFCSYLLALREDHSYVAYQAGNSARMIDHHYRCLVDRETALRFWNLRPLPLATIIDGGFGEVRLGPEPRGPGRPPKILAA